MAKNDFPKATAAGKYPLGHAKENKPASAYTGFEYPQGGGNDIGVYKQPMQNPNGNMTETVYGNQTTNSLNISVGNTSKGMVRGINPNGVKEMRGYGAATKGRKISGKQG
jgi:hypothetical protein